MTERIVNEFGFDTSDAIRNIGSVDAALAKLEGRLNTFGAAANKASTTGTSFQKMGTAGARSFDTLSNSAQRSGRNVLSVFDQLISANGRFTTSLALASRIVFTQAVVRSFRSLTSAISEGLASARRFGTEIVEIETIADGALGTFDELSSKVRAVSSAFNLPLSDASKALYDTISNQVVDTADSIAFLEKAAILAKGGVDTLENSVNVLSSTLNTLDLGLGDADRVSSQFFKAVEIGVFTMRELNAELPKVLPLAKQLGVSLEEVLAGLDTLTLRGAKPAQASTQLRGLFLGLIKPSEDMKAAFKELGFESVEQAIATEGLDGVLNKLIGTTDGTTESVGKLFRNQRALLGALQIGVQGTDDCARSLQEVSNVSSGLAKEKGLQVLAADAQVLEKAGQQISNTWEHVGEIVNHVIANNIRAFATLGKQLSGSADNADFEALATQVEDINNRLAKAGERRAQDLGKSLNAATQLRRGEIDLARATENTLIATARGGLNRIEQIGRQKLDALQKQITTAKQLIQDTPSRITDLEQKQANINFRSRLGGLDDAQKSLALQQQANRLADQASQALLSAARIGDQAGIERARASFNAATSTAEEAQSVAETAGAYDRAGQAARKLQDILAQQIRSEKEAVSIAQERLPILEKSATKQAENLANIQKAAKEFTKNLSVLDETGKTLPENVLQERQNALKESLQKLLDAGVTQEQLVPLIFDAETSINQVKQQVDQAFSNVKLQFAIDTGVDVRQLERILGQQFESPAGITAGLSQAAKELNDLQAAANNLSIAQQRVDTLTASIQKFNSTQISVNFDREFKSLGEVFPELKQVSQLSFVGLENLIDKIAEAGNFQNRFKLIQDLRKLQEELQSRNQLPQPDQDRAKILEELLAAQPAAQFTNAAVSIETAAANIATSFEQSAQAAEQSAQRAVQAAQQAAAAAAQAGGGGGGRAKGGFITGFAKGGLVKYFANGGLARGTDTIPAMLTRGEFVMPAKQTAEFFPQLQAMRAGITPSFTQSVSNTGISGDVVINVNGARQPELTAQAIDTILRRAARRGTI